MIKTKKENKKKKRKKNEEEKLPFTCQGLDAI
jgi:hypothetical protein